MRAPVLLLVAAATAAGGVWEEIGRNTDVAVRAEASSRRVDEGRAPDVGPVAVLVADARLSVPGSGLNLSAQVDVARSLDGAPRLDRRALGLFVERWDELSLLAVGVGFVDHLGDHPAAPGRSFAETVFHLSMSTFAGPDEPEAWNLGAVLAAVPRREETRGELRAWRGLWSRESLALELSLSAGTLRALDADGDGAGREEGWSYANASLVLAWTPSPGSRLGLEFKTQAATEDAGRADGVVSIGWGRSF